MSYLLEDKISQYGYHILLVLYGCGTDMEQPTDISLRYLRWRPLGVS